MFGHPQRTVARRIPLLRWGAPILWSLCFAAPARCDAAQPAGADLAVRVQTIFQKNCGTCHGKVNPQSGLTVLDHRQLIDKAMVVPNDLSKSQIWDRISTTDASSIMPPSPVAPLSAEDQAVVRQWIEAGAPEFTAALQTLGRPFLETRTVYEAIVRDLQKFNRAELKDVRYFSLTHLHNNPAVTDGDMRVYRAAFAKLANHLSWQTELHRPEAIDEHQTILRVRLSKLGWQKNKLWSKLVAKYPYAMAYDDVVDPVLKNAAKFIYDATGSRIPVIRADWFIATASQPPLYHEMLELPDGPDAAAKLEALLGVNVDRDIREQRIARAGFIKSNVSNNNRVVDRHEAAHGAYWKSYDFGGNSDKQNIINNPLGPPLKNHPFERFAFQHDGGELIFHLPNGFQGYLLVDAEGKRIDRGPIGIVFDAKQPLGNKEVINGISCMVCHARGMQPFQDDVRSAHSLQGDARSAVLEIYKPQAEMDALLAKDSARFMKALEIVAGPYLKTGDAANTPLEKFEEPIGAIARQYVQELGLTDVAAELGYVDPAALKSIFALPEYRTFGLAVLTEGKVIKRDAWDRLAPYSNFHQVGQRLDLGVPERFFE